MSRKLVNTICRTFPGAEVSDPWGGGHDAWKVRGKMFACIGAVMPGVSVKTDSVETAQMLIDAGIGVKAPYFHRSWVTLPWGTSKDELRARRETMARKSKRALGLTKASRFQCPLGRKFHRARRVPSNSATSASTATSPTRPVPAAGALNAPGSAGRLFAY
jgi:predicted DNA-binding protein (MmcQ/YjbR family)